MTAIYHIFITFYSFTIRLASFFNPKAKLWINGRKNLLKNIESSINKNDQIVWFHCASLGEFEQAKPFIERFKPVYPDYKILVTFFSPSGFEYRKNDSLIDYVFYLPIDTKRNAQTFIQLVNPKMVFFVKYEFWYNYIITIKENQLPLYLISGIFRENQLFFKWYGKWYKKILASFTYFFVQNEASKKLLLNHNYTNVIVSGDTRFDRVYENSIHPKQLPLIEQFKASKPLIVGGSTWANEEKLLADYSKNYPTQKLIIAPHDISEKHLNQIEQLFNYKCLRYSKATVDNITSCSVLLIDSIGLLANIYQYTDIAFVGGGFSGALHNILEPASFGNVVLFGPNHKKFHEAQELITANGAFEIADEASLAKTVNLVLTTIDSYKNNSREFVTTRIGASNMMLKFISDNNSTL